MPYAEVTEVQWKRFHLYEMLSKAYLLCEKIFSIVAWVPGWNRRLNAREHENFFYNYKTVLYLDYMHVIVYYYQNASKFTLIIGKLYCILPYIKQYISKQGKADRQVSSDIRKNC